MTVFLVRCLFTFPYSHKLCNLRVEDKKTTFIHNIIKTTEYSVKSPNIQCFCQLSLKALNPASVGKLGYNPTTSAVASKAL